jgi:hypothetical protein
MEAGRTADEGRIVGKEAIAVELDVLLENGADVVEGVGPLGVTSKLDPLPGRQAGRRPRAVRRGEPRVSARFGQRVQLRQTLIDAGQGQPPFPAIAVGWPI